VAVLVLGIAIGVAGHPRVVFAVAPEDDAVDPLFDEVDGKEPGFPDPLEGVNRGTFAFNRQLDRWVIDPVTRAYRFVVPAPARRAVRRALVNLDAPVTFVNDVLQLEPGDAAVTVTRFMLNTTVGVVGLFDVAAELDLEGHESDFGQTLALSGVASGPYLVIPLLGPNTLRDTAGWAVDMMFRPTTYLLTPGGAFFLSGFTETGTQLVVTTLWQNSTEIAEGFATREASGEALAALEASSVDYYAALRNAYYQNRTALIWRRGPDHGPLARALDLRELFSLRPTRGEVVDLPADGGDERVEPVALQD
jgi:phospholipid-binding lipoprotein MlaA